MTTSWNIEPATYDHAPGCRCPSCTATRTRLVPVLRACTRDNGNSWQTMTWQAMPGVSGPAGCEGCHAPPSDDPRAHAGDCPRRAAPEKAASAVSKPEPDPVREILAVIGEPLGLDDASLPSYASAPSGTCGSCHRGPLSRGNRCTYCAALDGLQAASASRRLSGAVPPRDHAERDCDYPRTAGLRLLTACAAVAAVLAVVLAILQKVPLP